MHYTDAQHTTQTEDGKPVLRYLLCSLEAIIEFNTEGVGIIRTDLQYNSGNRGQYVSVVV